MNLSKNCNTNLARYRLNQSLQSYRSSYGNKKLEQEVAVQLELFPLEDYTKKPQIELIPSLSCRGESRYQIVFQNLILAENLTAQEAFAIAKKIIPQQSQTSHRKKHQNNCKV
jgi:hypothetical protein